VKKILAVVLVAFFACSSLAAEKARPTAVDVSRLTPEQQQAVQAVANQMAEKSVEAPAIIAAIQSIDKDKLKGWAEAGTEAGRAVSNFAREIGVVAGEFLNSFVGKATFLLVFMNYGGGKLANFAFSVMLFMALTPLFALFVWKLFKRFVLQVSTTSDTKYNQNPWLRFCGFNEKTSRTESVKYEDENFRFWTPVIGWVFIFVSSWIYLANMWPKW